MNKYIYIFLLYAIVFLVEIDSVKASFFDYSLQETPYYLKEEGGKNLKILSRRDWKYHIYGVYREKLSFLSGNNLYLFPNMEYVITEWGDLLVEYKVDEGQWGVSDGKITFRSSQKQVGNNSLVDKNGNVPNLNFFVTGDLDKITNAFLISDLNLEILEKNSSRSGYLIKIISYFDWEEDFKNFDK